MVTVVCLCFKISCNANFKVVKSYVLCKITQIRSCIVRRSKLYLIYIKKKKKKTFEISENYIPNCLFVGFIKRLLKPLSSQYFDLGYTYCSKKHRYLP